MFLPAATPRALVPAVEPRPPTGEHRSGTGRRRRPATGRRRPDDPALADGERVYASWAVFAARTVGAAAGLRDQFGLPPGDRVAIVMRNRPEYLEALFAIWHAGLVAVPVNARLHRDEVAYVLEDSGSAVVVTDADHAADVESLVGAVDSLQAVVVAPGERWDRLTASSAVSCCASRGVRPAQRGQIGVPRPSAAATTAVGHRTPRGTWRCAGVHRQVPPSNR